MRPTLLSASLLFCLAAPAARAQGATPADLIVTNARIYTVDDGRPMAEAMAVRAGRVQFVGSERGALTLRGPQTRVLDAAGATIIPGIADAHVHLLNLGMALRTVSLVGARTYDEVIERIAAKARELPAGTWITGRGWDQNDWPDTRLPSHEPLSRAVPNHPVSVTRIDGHATLVNAAAMRIANLTAATTDPAGGRIERTGRHSRGQSLGSHQRARRGRGGGGRGRLRGARARGTVLAPQLRHDPSGRFHPRPILSARTPERAS
jgi:predicted amidohydrolase YtcJ